MKYLLIGLFLFSNVCFANDKDKIIKDFSKLSQEQKRSALAVMLDGVEHEMFGFHVTKSKEELKKYGGLPGYEIVHYARYDSGGLTLPVFRVYDYNNKLIDTVVAGALLKDGKTFHHIGGFSKAYDFNQVRINGEIVDKMEADIRKKIMNSPVQRATENQQAYTPEFFQNLKNDDFIDIAQNQDALSGKGYDVNCLATAIRETKEETGMILNPEEMILLSVFSEIRDQETKKSYKISANTTGACYFMFEAGSIKLDKKGKIKFVSLNEKTILNADTIKENLDIENLKLKGFDDSDNGIVFVSQKSLTKVSDKKQNTAYSYKAKTLIDEKEVNFYMPFGRAINLVPKNTKYKTCNNIEFLTVGSFVPSKNTINSWEEINTLNIKTIC